MAKVINLNTAGLKQIMVFVQDNIEKKRREVAVTVLRELHLIAPVDTGRLRIGFKPSLNAPSDYIPSEGYYPTYTIDTSEWDGAGADDVYYITNNVPYATKVNNGTVKMAPQRFVERAISVVGRVVG